MRLNPTPQFKKDVSRLTQRIQQQLKKKLELLLRDARHPSLRTRKIKGEVLGFRNVFEGSITKNYRFLFRREGDAYILLRCGTHTEIFGR